MSAIITSNLYIFYPIFKNHFLFSRRFFQKICKVSVSERFVIKSRYGTYLELKYCIFYFGINFSPLCCCRGYMLILIYKKEWVTKNMEVLLTQKRERKFGEIFQQKQLQEFKECRLRHLKVWNHCPKVFSLVLTFKTIDTNIMINMHLKVRLSRNKFMKSSIDPKKQLKNLKDFCPSL